MDLDKIKKDLGIEYTDIQELDNGKGGIGELYKAHRVRLDVDVVIKCIQQQYIGNIDQSREANILKNLKHQYLPKIYDIIKGSDDVVYTIMEFIPGISMEKYVRKNGPANQALALRWAKQIAEVTAYLHEQEPPIIHCDIKPANIMITGSNDICLIDFNTSMLLKAGAASIGATPGYAAPEQYGNHIVSIEPVDDDEDKTEILIENVEANNISHKDEKRSKRTNSAKDSNIGSGVARGNDSYISTRTDVYSIGASLYYLICGYSPQSSFQEVTPVSAYRPAVSITVQKIIEKAMQKNPAKRYSDSGELLAAIGGVKKADSQRRLIHIVLGIVIAASVFGAVILYQRNVYEKRPEVIFRKELETGNLCMAQSNDREALKHYIKAWKIDRNNTEINRILGSYYMNKVDVHSRTGMYEEAISLIHLAELFQPDAYDYKNERAKLYQGVADEKISDKDYEAAYSILEDGYQETGVTSLREVEIKTYLSQAAEISIEQGEINAAQYLCSITNKDIRNDDQINDTAAGYYYTVAQDYIEKRDYYVALNIIKTALDKTRDSRFITLSEEISGETDKIQKKEQVELLIPDIFHQHEEMKPKEFINFIQSDCTSLILLCDAYGGSYFDPDKGYGVYYVEGENRARIYMMYIGEYENEKRNGQGEWYSMTGDTLYYDIGNWSEDKPDGAHDASVFHSGGNKSRICGDVKDGLWDGKLTFYSSGRVYYGSAENGYIKQIRKYGSHLIFGENGNSYYYTTETSYFEKTKGILGYSDDVN